MTLIIEIKSPTISEISGISKAGKPYKIYKQIGWAYTYAAPDNPNPYPERIEMTLNEGQSPFEVGRYQLDPASFFVGDFHSLSVGRPILKPIAPLQPVRS